MVLLLLREPPLRQVLLWLREEQQGSLPELVQEPLQGEAGALTGQ